MAELHSTPEANKAAALAKLKQHDDAIRANGIKTGYANRDAEWRAALGVGSMDEAREVTQLRARPTVQEELKHGRFRFWQGAAFGGVVGAALMLAAGATLLGQSFEQARQYGAGMVAVGAATQAANPPSTCIPGETLQDGRVCPLTTDTRVTP